MNKKTGKVQKRCSTKLGTVPCKTLHIAKANGLLGEEILNSDEGLGEAASEASATLLGGAAEPMPSVKIEW